MRWADGAGIFLTISAAGESQPSPTPSASGNRERTATYIAGIDQAALGGGWRFGKQSGKARHTGFLLSLKEYYNIEIGMGESGNSEAGSPSGTGLFPPNTRDDHQIAAIEENLWARFDGRRSATSKAALYGNAAGITADSELTFARWR